MFMPELLGNPSYMSSFLPACTDSKFPRFEKERCRNPKADEASRTLKKLSKISLLCISQKILGRLIYVRVEPIIDPLLLRVKVRFPRPPPFQSLYIYVYIFPPRFPKSLSTRTI